MNRFQQLFDLFREKIEPLLTEGEMHALVFSYKYDSATNTGEFNVYRNHRVEDVTRFFIEGAQLIQPGNQIVYDDTVWFFYENICDRKLEAHINYTPEHRERIIVQLSSPLIKMSVPNPPYVSGLTQAAVATA